MSCVTPMRPLVVEKSSHLFPHHLCLRRQRQGFEPKCAHTDLSGFSATDTVPVVWKSPPAHHAPLNSGFRFSRNAFTASCWSAVCCTNACMLAAISRCVGSPIALESRKSFLHIRSECGGYDAI